MSYSSVKVIHLLNTLQRLSLSPPNSGNYSAVAISQTQIRWEKYSFIKVPVCNLDTKGLLSLTIPSGPV